MGEEAGQVEVVVGIKASPGSRTRTAMSPSRIIIDTVSRSYGANGLVPHHLSKTNEVVWVVYCCGKSTNELGSSLELEIGAMGRLYCY